MDQYEMIRTSCRVYGQNVSEMARMTGHSRNTIKKAIRGEPWGYKERSHQPFPVLDKYLAVIDGWLTGDKCSPKKQRHTARRIYNRLVEEHRYTGSEKGLTTPLFEEIFPRLSLPRKYRQNFLSRRGSHPWLGRFLRDGRR